MQCNKNPKQKPFFNGIRINKQNVYKLLNRVSLNRDAAVWAGDQGDRCPRLV